MQADSLLPGTDLPMEVQEGSCRQEFHTKFAPGASRDVLALTLGSNCIYTLCLGCHVTQFLHPEGPPETPEWLKSQRSRGSSRRLSVHSMPSNVMEKRRKQKVCVLCGVEAVRQVAGLRMCGDHATAAEERGM